MEHVELIYLDANASEPLHPAAAAAMAAAFTVTGNPASIHAAGRAARSLVEQARRRIALCLNIDGADLVFCSGGTEATAMAIAALAPGRRVLIGATEHDAARAACAPHAPAILPVHEDGTLVLDALRQALNGPPALVCCMLANNETGVLHPMAEVAALCRDAGALLHVDAVQAAGRLPIDARALGATTLALSAHKLGGPQGVGALVLAPGLHLPALIAGGGQEQGRRGGTPPVAAIAGFAAAIEAAVPRAPALRDALEACAVGAGAIVCGTGPRLPNTSCLALPALRAETQLITLDLAGIAVSAGAACSSGKMASSHVLTAMGLDALAGHAIRVSLPWNATAADVDAFGRAYLAMAQRVRAAA